MDGKALRLSFDNFCDRKAAHILSAFASDPALVLARLECDEKSNEIPAVQSLLRQLGLEQAVLTVVLDSTQRALRVATGRDDGGWLALGEAKLERGPQLLQVEKRPRCPKWRRR